MSPGAKDILVIETKVKSIHLHFFIMRM